MSALTPQDLQELTARGLAPAEVERQVALLSSPPPAAVLARPCRIADGIMAVKMEAAAADGRLFNRAREDGLLAKFVPASGAATRMFKDVLAWRAAHPRDTLEQMSQQAHASPEAAETLKFVRNLRHFAFFEALRAALGGRGGDPLELLRRDDFAPCVDALLSPEGLALASRPKGVIPFHRYKSRARTPFEEHLIESVDILRDKDGVCRVHFTISQEHEALFRALAAEVVPRLEAERHCKFDVSFSHQAPSTDTVALEASGALARTPEGRLLFRPGGHGALLKNLGEVKADVVLVKNIDNIPHESQPGDNAYWESLQVGLLLELQGEVFNRLSWLTTRPADARILAEAEHYAAQKLNIVRPVPDAAADEAQEHQRRREWLMAKLNRPLRVCAMVRNTGEPGGAPFWVRGKDGSLSVQIVESAQVSKDAEQQKIFRASGHFNPVNMACALKDWRGNHFDLARFTDPSAVFVSEKSAGGRPLRVLERPGLWNGGMADWITVFIETPLSTFHPVKTVNDLLRADHQPAVAGHAAQEAP